MCSTFFSESAPAQPQNERQNNKHIFRAFVRERARPFVGYTTPKSSRIRTRSAHINLCASTRQHKRLTHEHTRTSSQKHEGLLLPPIRAVSDGRTLFFALDARVCSFLRRARAAIVSVSAAFRFCCVGFCCCPVANVCCCSLFAPAQNATSTCLCSRT